MVMKSGGKKVSLTEMRLPAKFTAVHRLAWRVSHRESRQQQPTFRVPANQTCFCRRLSMVLLRNKLSLPDVVWVSLPQGEDRSWTCSQDHPQAALSLGYRIGTAPSPDQRICSRARAAPPSRQPVLWSSNLKPIATTCPWLPPRV